MPRSFAITPQMPFMTWNMAHFSPVATSRGKYILKNRGIHYF